MSSSIKRLGWIGVEADGSPYHAQRGNGRHSRKEPIKVYSSEERAKSMTTGRAVEVFIKEDPSE